MARRLSFASSHRLFVFLTAFGFALWGAAAVHAQAPIITSISSPRQVVVNGDSLTLTVNAIDATGYQWMRNGRLLPGATAATYTLTNAAAYRDAGWYQVAASNGAGAATSPVVFVNVTVNPPEFLVSGQSVGAAPVGLTSASAIASGIGFYVVLKGDGTVVATGSSSSGVLSLPAGLSSVVGISANGSQCVALKSDGTVVTWGVGVTAPPPAGLSNIVQVAAGGNHVLALKADRSVVAWGANYSGQTNVPAGLSGVIAVAASPFHSVALKADGTVVAWGMNDVGQATVPAGLSNVVALSANFAHTLALKSDGTVVGWGTSFLGRASPPAGLVAVAIGAGAYHSVALKADGTAVGWGYNASGESTFSAAATKIVAIAPGDSTTLLLRDGAIPGLPILTSQPANAVSMLGGSAAFTVGAAGTGLTYQWFHNGAAVAGATGATLSLTNLQTADVGNYYVTITGSAGSVTSATATLTGANAAPSIPTQPANLTVISGQAATFSVTATGSGTLTYQWRQNGFPISGATSASYPLAAARRTDADFYDVQVFDGLAFTVSHAARLSVAPTAYSGFVAPDPAWSLRPESMGNGQIYFAASLSDGRTYIAGAYSSVDGVRRTSLSRVNADGTLDSSFVPPEIDSQVLTLAVQADGKLLLGGDFLRVDGVLSKRLARLHSDGRLDTSFNVGAAVNGGVNALAVQADGKVLVCGGFIGFAGSTRNYVVRLNTDGSLDSGFLTRGMGSFVRSVLVQGDGKIVLGGNFTTYVDHNGTTMACTRLARLNADGTLDTSFSPAPNAGVSTLAVQGDGKIIAGGSFTFVGSTATRRVCRINSDGTLDAAFSTGTGTGFNFDVNTVALQADGKILVGGGFTTFAGVAAMNLIRLNSSGSRDTGFLSKGMDSTVNVVAAQPDGKIVVGGAFLNYFDASGATTVRPRVARLTSAGALDPGLNSTWGNPGAIFAQLPIAGGKTLVAGLFTVLRGAAVPAHLALLNADASVDASFNSGGSGANAQIYAVLRQPDGKFLITGMFTTYNGASANRIARLNADGTRDTTFSPGAGLNFVGYTLGLLSGGRILVGGLFTMVGTTARNGVAVLNPDGSVDINFSPGSGTTAGVFCSLVQGDGKIVLGGAFTAFNGTPVGSIVRLNPDGATDTAFDTRSGAHGSVFAFGSGPEGKIVIGGTFDSYMTVPTSGLGVSVPRSGIARLNASDGSLDTTFVPVELVGFRMVSALLVQEDGRVLVRGPFDSIGGSPATAFLGRFNVDGSLDPTFAAGGFSLSDATPATMAMDDAGRVLMSANGSQAAAATRAAALPAITTQPMTQHVAVGTTGTLSVAASTVLPVRYQWSFNNAPIPGAIGATLAVTNFQSANAGTYAVTVANELGSTTSTAAVVAVGVVPTITTQPVAVSVSAGGGTSFVVVAAGLPAPTYQWQRQSAGTVGFSNVSDTGGFSGSTNATLTLTAATVALHGDQFQCIVSNGVGAPIVTVPAVLTVTSAPVITSAASAKFIVGRPGSFAMQVASFPASIWSVSGGALPPWATLNGTTGAITGTAPDATASPFVFTLTATNGIGIAATQTLTLIVQPGHSADVSPADGMLNLAELTRVIELYNTSTGTVRTGRHVVSASSVDGYAPDPGVTAGPIPTTPHTADLNRDGRLSLTELTRVIELFNTRSGTTRTGAYHAAASPIATEDGFASGP